MAKLLTCSGCKFSPKTCEVAASMRAAVKGLSVRTMKFGCPKREDALASGDAAIFQTFTYRDDEYENTVAVSYPGYVLGMKGGSVYGFVKPGTPDESNGYPFEPRSGGYVKMPIARVRTDPTRPTIPDLKACRWCNMHPALGAACQKDPHNTPREACEADRLQAAARAALTEGQKP